MRAFDLETFPFGHGNMAPTIVCGAEAKTKQQTQFLRDPRNIEECVYGLPGEVVAGANIAYDFGCIYKQNPKLFSRIWDLYANGQVHDILIVATLRAIEEGRLHDGALFNRSGKPMKDPISGALTNRYSLAVCVEEYLHRSDAKANAAYRTAYDKLYDSPTSAWPKEAVQYVLDDANNTLAVAEAQGPLSEEAKRQAWTAWCMHLGVINSVTVDRERAKAWLKEVELKRDAEVVKWAMRGFYYGKKDGLCKDTKFLKKAVTEAYKNNPPRTETGAVATDRTTLLASGNTDLMEFSKISKLDKQLVYANELSNLPGPKMSVRGNPLLASGRASYEGLIQLIPREGSARECFVAPEGRVLCSVDYAAVEASTLAQVCLWTVGESELAAALNKNLDPHNHFAALMLNTAYDEFSKKAKDKHSAEAALRQATKAANYGFPGMMSPETFVSAKRREGLSICKLMDNSVQCGALTFMHKVESSLKRELLCRACVNEAKKLRTWYLRTWPEMRKYWDWVFKRLNKPLEQFVSGRLRKCTTGPAAANTLFQGLAADMVKEALRNMTKEMYLDTQSPLYGSRLVIFAHDEIILDLPEERAHEAALRQAAVMLEVKPKYLPDVPLKAEPALMRRWTKFAEPKFENGRLVSWN